MGGMTHIDQEFTECSWEAPHCQHVMTLERVFLCLICSHCEHVHKMLTTRIE